MYKLQDFNHVIKMIHIAEQSSFWIFGQKWKKKDNYYHGFNHGFGLQLKCSSVYAATLTSYSHKLGDKTRYPRLFFRLTSFMSLFLSSHSLAFVAILLLSWEMLSWKTNVSFEVYSLWKCADIQACSHQIFTAR